MRKDQENWGGGRHIKRERQVAIMQRQLYLAHWYYHHNPETILSTTSVEAALNALWPAFMGGDCPDHPNAALNQLKRTVTTSPSPLLAFLAVALAIDFFFDLPLG
jgi:hypothetical protein